MILKFKDTLDEIIQCRNIEIESCIGDNGIFCVWAEVNRAESAGKFVGIRGQSRVETLIIANWILARHVSSDSCQRGVGREMLAESRYRGESIGILTRTFRWPIPN